MYTYIGAGLGVIALSAWALSKTRHPSKKFGLETVPVTGALRPINFVFDIVRGTTGLSIINIQKDKFNKQAKEIADLTDTELFGPQDEFLKAVDLFVSEPDQSLMSASGILLFNGLMKRILDARKATIMYIQEHREQILNSHVEKPIIISGLPRTGSTMLYNLLSCDPVARAPRFFEMSQMSIPVPPVTSLENRDSDSRIKSCLDRFDETERLYPGMWTEAGKSHRSHPNEIEEDLLVVFHSLIMQLHVPLAGKGYREWYEDENNKKFAYVYHRLFFQMLNQAWTPDSHWVLKAPLHSTYLDSLLEQYPDARIIITHRDPKAVVPSWARLLESYLNWSYIPYACDRIKYGRYIADSLVLCAKRIMIWEDKTDSKVYFDVIYSEMVKDPIAMVEKIYEYFDLPMTEQFRENMREWIKENRQGKYGRREYSLADYDLTEQQIEDEFKEYNERYLKNK